MATLLSGFIGISAWVSVGGFGSVRDLGLSSALVNPFHFSEPASETMATESTTPGTAIQPLYTYFALVNVSVIHSANTNPQTPARGPAS